MKFILLLLALGAATFTIAEKVRYDSYEVHQLIPKTQRQLQALRQFQLSYEFDFWTAPRKIGLPVKVLVPPNKKHFFQQYMKNFGIEDQVQIDNLQKIIDEEEQRLALRSTKRVDWSDYNTLEELDAWLDELEGRYDNVKVVIAGQSYEGRNIKAIEINNGDGLPGVVIESGIHAREWITTAASSWFINQILEDTSDPIWRQFNWLYIPHVNPDGYAYTWESDRLWRKTRKPYKLGLITCYGADPNRNWDNHWNQGGSSTNPCSETFAGSGPASEVEIQTLQDYLRQSSKVRNNRIYIAFHSYAQVILYPYGYTGTPAPSANLWQRIGEAAAESLRQVHGTRFEVGSIYDIMYVSSGSSLEWYYDELNATISFAYEMRDTGRYGFELPPDQIIPTGEEHLASLRTILEEYQNTKK